MSSKFYQIDENNISNEELICGIECQFKFNFSEQSTSFKTCIKDTSNNNQLQNLPYLQITNDFLNNTSNPGLIAVNFQNNNYWFDSIYIMKPGYIYMDFKSSILYGNGNNRSLVTNPNPIDASSSTLIIKCKSSNQNYLYIYQNILYRPTPPNDSRAQEITYVINAISNALGDNQDQLTNIACGTNTALQLSRFNVNNLIPTTKKYFYFKESSNSNNYNIVFSLPNSIILSNNIKDTLNSFFTNIFVKLTSSSYTAIPSSNIKVFTSSKYPINNISDNEDDIYIRCQPTDQEGNILVSEDNSNKTSNNPFNLNDVLGENKNMFTAAIMGIVLMIFIVKGGEFLLKTGTRTLLVSL